MQKLGPTTPTELPRLLGLRDLVLLNVVAVVNLNLVPVAASGGFPALTLWGLALALFFLPQGIAVAEFSARYPEEGGIYVWTRKLFGDFHGWLCGWCYWTNNIFYVPTLLLYLVGISLYAGGPELTRLGENRLFVFVSALVLLWFFTALNIRGLGVGKWVNNVGGIGAAVAAAMLVTAGVLALRHQGERPRLGASDFFPDLHALDEWRTVSALSVICFGLVGLELGSVMGGEIREPRRNVPRAALLGGLACAALYLSATLALLLALPVNELSVIQGVLQAFEHMADRAGLGGLLAPLALVLTISIAGATSAWLGGSARIPFVAGLDRYLPEPLARLHPRWRTPYIALIAHAAASSVFLSMSFIGVRVRDAYLTLLELAVVLQLIPFLYLYAGLIRVAGTPGGHYRSRAGVMLSGVAGLLATFLALATAFVPSKSVESIWKFELKLALGVALFVGAAAVLPRFSRRASSAAES